MFFLVIPSPSMLMDVPGILVEVVAIICAGTLALKSGAQCPLIIAMREYR